MLPLDTEDAVGAIREAGSWTGLVGDLGLGLTKPVSLAEILSGCGFLVTLEAVGLVTEAPVLGVVAGSLLTAGSFLTTGFSGAFTTGLVAVLWVALVGVFVTEGDFASGLVVVGFVDMVLGRVVVFLVAVDFAGVVEAGSLCFSALCLPLTATGVGVALVS